MAWNDIPSASAYFDSLYGSTWADISSGDQGKLLNQANLIITNDPRLSFPEEIQPNMQKAEAQLAFDIYSGEYNPTIGQLQSQGLKRYKLSLHELEFRDNYKGRSGQGYSPLVENLLSPYKTRRGLTYAERDRCD